jgi:circadian clock protein KaiC
MLGGGLTAGTSTLAAGSPGTGKTLLGLHFLTAGVRDLAEPGLFVGFMESATQLRAKARMFGLDLSAAEAAGRLRLLVLPGYDLEADYIAALLSADIEQRGVRRLVIDSAVELERGLADRVRLPDFLSALVRYLRGRDVTTYLTLDIPTIVGQELSFAATPLSVLAENLVILRHVEYRGQLRRVFSLFKMRFSDYDPTIREFTIVPDHGIQIQAALAATGLLTGIAQPLEDAPTQHGPAGYRDRHG